MPVQKMNYPIIITMFFCIILSVCSQSMCETKFFPDTIPITVDTNLTFDLSQYIKGKNMTLSITPKNEHFQLKPTIQRQQFDFPNRGILKSLQAYQVISNSNSQLDALQKDLSISFLTDLGGNNTIYYGNASSWGSQMPSIKIQNLFGLQCTDHCLFASGDFMITCRNISQQNQSAKKLFGGTNYTYNAFGSIPRNYSLNQSVKVQIVKSQIYSSFSQSHFEFQLIKLASGSVAKIFKVAGQEIDNNNNGYIEIWNIKGREVQFLYDRNYFGLKKLAIMDVKANLKNSGNWLHQGVFDQIFILNYYTGLYKLQERNSELRITQFWQSPFFQAIAIQQQGLILAKQGLLWEIDQQGILKYQTISAQNSPSSDTIIDTNERYLVHLDHGTRSFLTIYRRRIRTPYYSLPVSKFTKYVKIFSHGILVMQNRQIQINAQFIRVHEPNLSLMSSKLTPIQNNTRIRIVASSIFFQDKTDCEVRTTVIILNITDQTIWLKGIDLSENQQIYMNRPGLAEIDLSQYVAGSNLSYSIINFSPQLVFDYNFQKIVRNKSLIINLKQYEKNQTQIASADICGYDLIRLQLKKSELGVYLSCQRTFQDSLSCIQAWRQPIMKDTNNSRFKIQYCKWLNKDYLNYNIIQIQYSKTKIILRQLDANAYPVPLAVITYQNQGQAIDALDTTNLPNGNIGIFVLLRLMKKIDFYECDRLSCKLQLTIDKTLLKGRYFSPQNFTKIDKEPNKNNNDVVRSQQIFLIKQFNQLSILRIKFSKNHFMTPQIVELSQPCIVNEVSIDGNFTYAITYPNILISSKQIHLHQYIIYLDSLDHYRIKYTREIPIYDNMHNDGNIVILDQKSLIGVYLFDPKNPKYKKLGIYHLDALTLFETYYGQLDFLESRDKYFFLPYDFILLSNELLIIPNILPTPMPLPEPSVLLEYVKIYPKATLQLYLDQDETDVDKDIFYIVFENQHDRLRHMLTLTIADYPDDIDLGVNYPYVQLSYNSQQNITIDTFKWFTGNILYYEYLCKDCISVDENSPRVLVRDKINIEQVYHLYESSKMYYRNNKVFFLTNNFIYSYQVDLQQSIGNFSKSYMISSDSKCIDFLFINDQLIMAVCGNKVIAYSFTSYGGNVAGQFQIPNGMIAKNNPLHFKENILIVQSTAGIYLFAIQYLNIPTLAQYIDYNEYGQICSVQLLLYQTRPIQYQAILSLCKSGIVILTFSVKTNRRGQSFISYIYKQQIDLEKALQRQLIRMPTSSSFKSTNTQISKNGNQDDYTMTIISIVDRFNTFIWQISFQAHAAYYIQLKSIVHKYQNYYATGKHFKYQSPNKTENYLIIQFQYYNAIMYGVYDLNEFQSQSTIYQNHYMMQAFPVDGSALIQFTDIKVRDKLGVIAFSQKNLYLIRIGSKVEIHITDPETLYTQKLLIIPSTVQNTRRVTIQLKGIDLVEWYWWEIFLIIIACLAFLVLVYYIVKYVWKKYQERKKLIPLLIDYHEQQAEYQEDRLDRQIQQLKKKKGEKNGSQQQEQIDVSPSKPQNSENNVGPDIQEVQQINIDSHWGINQSQRDSKPNIQDFQQQKEVNHS